MNKFLDEEDSIIKQEIDIEALFLYKKIENTNLKLSEYKNFIIPAPKEREWMNQESSKFSYACLPLVSANNFGWWILNMEEIEVEWNGDPAIDAVKINYTDNKARYKYASSHFGSGILTFGIPLLFKTTLGWGIYVSGPSNLFIDGMFPLEAIVETNWSPFTFTMNYKITRTNHKIKIPKYHPICRISPIQLNLNEKTNLKLKYLEEYPELEKDHVEWVEERKKFIDDERKGNERMLHYKDGINIKGCPFLGMHKLNYKYKKVEEV